MTDGSAFYPKYKRLSVDSIDLYFKKLHPDIIEKERYTVMRNSPEYNNQICDMNATPQSLTFCNSDIHFATRLDQPIFVGELGHRVILALGQQGGFRNPFVWSMKGIHLYDRVSNVLKKYFSHVSHQNRRITEEMIKENFEFYKSDPEITNIDAFICLFQPGMCEMWLPFKMTVFIPAHHYNMGRCSIEETKWPHITYFDNFKDLEEKLLTADFDRIHTLMVKENKRRRKQLENIIGALFSRK